jgi:hypothetical protein
MSNYTLYANFPPSRVDKIKQVIGAVRLKYPELYCPNEEPHLTILYGPQLGPEEKELTQYHRDWIERLYPGLHDLVDARNSIDLDFMGVSHFKRGDKYIIKLEFRSNTLTQFQTDLRKKLPEVNTAYLSAHVTDGDDSRALTPKRWLHVTVAVVNNITLVPEIEEYIRDLTAEFPVYMRIDYFSVISALTDVPIAIPNS